MSGLEWVAVLVKERRLPLLDFHMTNDLDLV
jgi:hypothetical protein